MSAALGAVIVVKMSLHAARGRELVVTAAHDAAMLSRITATIALHPVAAFSYILEPQGEMAVVHLEVLGGTWQEDRVQQKLRRLIGVLDARYAD
jgi:hypothetical protein